MLRQIVTSLCCLETKRLISTSAARLHRVTLIGGGGGIGQAMAMLLKADPLVTDLVIWDVKNINGIAVDVSHIDTFSGVQGFVGTDKLPDALSCSNLVVVAAGIPRSAEMDTREKLFEANAEIIYQIASQKAEHCPEALLAIITNPLNSMLPLAAEVLRQRNAHDPNKLFGISKLDSMRTRTFIGDYLVVDPRKLSVNVIGGHSDATIVPVISQTTPAVKGDPDEIREIYGRIINAGNAVAKAKEGKGAAQLAMAHVAMTFCNSLLNALNGKSGISDVAYVESSVHPDLKYFSSIFDLGKGGIKKFHPMPKLNDHEKTLLEKAIPQLKANIELGLKFAQSKKGDKKVEKKADCKN